MTRHLAPVLEYRQQPTPERDAYEQVLDELTAAAQAVREAVTSGNDALLSSTLLRLADASQSVEELAAAFRMLATSELPVSALIEVGLALAGARTPSRAVRAV